MAAGGVTCSGVGEGAGAKGVGLDDADGVAGGAGGAEDAVGAGQLNHFVKARASFATKVNEWPPVGELVVTGTFSAVSFFDHAAICPRIGVV